MSNEELLKAGIAAAQSGDLNRAAGFFAELVKVDPNSEQGWLMLGMCLSAPDRRAYCLNRVLAINPNNSEARRQLGRIGGASVPASPKPSAPPPPPAEPPAWATPAPEQGANPASRPRTVQVPDRPSTPAPAPRAQPLHSSPFYYDDGLEPSSDSSTRDSYYPYGNEEKDLPSEEVAIPVESPAPRKASPPPRRKKPSKLWLALIVSSTALCTVCIVGGAYLWLTGGTSGLSSLIPAPVEIPTALLMPTAGPTQAVASASAATSTAPAAPTVLPSPRPTVSYTPSFENSGCKFDVPSGANASCGYLIVPEDRAGDPSHTIRLAVVVYHSKSSDPDPVPVLFLQGGPGGEAVRLSAEAYSLLVAPFTSRRDFIAYDQRGTGLSEPALNCDELTKAYLQDIHGQVPASARKIVYSNAFLSCQGLMTVKGIDLKAYTTEESAADVRDLLSVLGYKQVDLYGASYGTRLAEVVMRDHPQIVHSAILDSVVPIETNFFFEYPQAIQTALKRLFEACAADSTCNTAYPNLEAVFWEQVQRLDAKPVTLTIANPRTGSITENVDGAVFMEIVLGSMKQSGLIYTAPQTIYRFKAGDYSSVLAAETTLPFTFEGISAGLYISMMCHEQILATSTDQLQASSGGPVDIRDYAWLPFYGDAQDVFHACQSWGAVGPSLGENDAIASSDIPTLVITGKFDPTTPPQYAQQVAAHLTHSYYFEFPNQGHTPTAADQSGCAMGIAVAFLNNPSVEPDRSCLDELPPVAFLLPYTGDPKIELKEASPLGISARVPKDWVTLGDGFYLRENSPFDVTQIGIMPVPGTTSAALMQWLSMKAYGYRGLDSAPVQAGQRHANGLDWTLYTSTSYGRPVDIAMADYNHGSLVILAFSDIDEHDALYRTVFLPMVDSVRP